MTKFATPMDHMSKFCKDKNYTKFASIYYRSLISLTSLLSCSVRPYFKFPSIQRFSAKRSAVSRNGCGCQLLALFLAHVHLCCIRSWVNLLGDVSPDANGFLEVTFGNRATSPRMAPTQSVNASPHQLALNFPHRCALAELVLNGE
ncbi:hypothetical protein BIW11_03392 [Tropilaelaps mercedesae]|uniref:Uncharacterized protein n=1 Tax=Tropilaelaps mercedesae TaxID=418985 RepID=A0A1V9XMA2_9ACAR|nr:hypothetical protein BIW11_03392 [Tropilaelaps mercedesae]